MDVPECDCRELVLERTVKNPSSPNLGKKFYCCRKKKCGFFLWKDLFARIGQPRKCQHKLSVKVFLRKGRLTEACTQQDACFKPRTIVESSLRTVDGLADQMEKLALQSSSDSKQDSSQIDELTAQISSLRLDNHSQPLVVESSEVSSQKFVSDE